MAGVGDDEAAGGTHLFALCQRGATSVGHAVEQKPHGLAHKRHVFKIHARFRLVKEQQIGLLGHELQQFRALDLAARKARVHVALKKMIKMHLAGHAFNIQLASTPAQFHQLARGQAVDGGGALKRHANAKARTLVHGRVGDVCALVDNLALRDLVSRKAHEGHEQGGFARAVGAKKNECFARAHMQVNALEYGRALDRNMQITDFKHLLLRFRPDTPEHRNAHDPAGGSAWRRIHRPQHCQAASQ